MFMYVLIRWDLRLWNYPVKEWPIYFKSSLFYLSREIVFVKVLIFYAAPNLNASYNISKFCDYFVQELFSWNQNILTRPALIRLQIWFQLLEALSRRLLVRTRPTYKTEWSIGFPFYGNAGCNRQYTPHLHIWGLWLERSKSHIANSEAKLVRIGVEIS